jgi:hypothetical protein
MQKQEQACLNDPGDCMMQAAEAVTLLIATPHFVMSRKSI